MSESDIPPSAEQETIPFLSFPSLRDTHGELLKRRRKGEGKTAVFWDDVLEFLRRGEAAGAFLDDDSQRESAQNLLDYWHNQLFHAGKKPPEAILADFDPMQQPEIPDEKKPYIGLDAFDDSNAHLFFGRSQLIKTLLTHMTTSRLVAAVGPSGSGKSSVVLAGLLPKLKAGALAGSRDWHFCPPMVPGSTPVTQLARAIAPTDNIDQEWVTGTVAKLLSDSKALPQIMDDLYSQTAVITIDQFEETFTLCQNESERQAFLECLLQLIRSDGPRHMVLLTMRSDYESYLNKAPLFQSMYEQGVVRVAAMTGAELRQAIEKPAEAIGLKFDAGLVDRLVQEIVGEPAALPLLQFALLKLWDNRERNRITWEGYRRLGGVMQALAHTADQVFDSLLPEEQVTARRIFLRIVRPSEGLEITRNRIRRKSLHLTGEAKDRIDRVLDKLVESRLLRLTKGNTPEDDQVEVAHEALVRNWPRLVEWLEDERVSLRRRQRLTTQAEHWETLGRDDGALLRGAALQEALQYVDLSEMEEALVAASQLALRQEEKVRLTQLEKLAEEQRQRAEAEEEARLKAEEAARLQQLAARRARYFSIALGVIFIVGVGALLLFSANNQLESEATIAANEQENLAVEGTNQALSAQNSQLIIEAQQTKQAVSAQQNEERATVAAQGTATAVVVTAEARLQAVQLTAESATAEAQLRPTEEPISGVEATPDPQTILTEYGLSAQINADIRPKDNMPMMFITGGIFTMGAEAGQIGVQSNELPAHEVTLESYFLDQHEVSVQQFAAFLNDIEGYRDNCSGFDCTETSFESKFTYLLNNLGTYEPRVGFENYPINWVSWYGARDYCAWAGGRLPTEAEWEYAARGIDGRRFPWGNDEPDDNKAVFNHPTTETGFSHALKPVDALPEGASPFGVLNMAGSMWEWVEDNYSPDAYETDPGPGPYLSNENDERVLRGGAWEDDASKLRATGRFHLPPAMNRDELGLLIYWSVGFRCAKASVITQ